MIRGTTPTHTFTLPPNLNASQIKRLKIIYAQGDEPLFCKETDDCVISGDTIQTTLTQEETFMFNCKNMVQMQIRVLTVDGEVIASDEMYASVEKCLDDEVMA